MESKVLAGDEPRKITFPLIAKSVHTGAVVLFSSPKKGTLLVKGSSISRVGDHSSAWNDATNPEDWGILDDVTIQFAI